MLISWFVTLITSFFAANNLHAYDLHIDTNNYFLMFMAYLAQTNNFFPMFDAYIPITLLWIGIYTGLSGIKVFEVLVNVFRGAGLRL